MLAVRLALACTLFAANVVLAQPYVVSTQSAPFVPVATSATKLVLQGTAPTDNGRADVPIGFVFPFFGQSHSQLTVTANGVAIFDPGACSACDFPQNANIPTTTLPNGVLAPFWDDLKLSWPSSGVWYETRAGQTDAGTPFQTLVIEWRDLNHWFATSQYKITVQLHLSSSGEIAFHYGPVTGTGAVLSATVGIESPDGSNGTVGKACSPSCGSASLSPDERILFAAPAAVELSVASVVLESIGRVTDGGTQLEVTATTTVRNFSQLDAPSVSYALFLSEDRFYSPLTDVPLSPSTLGPLAVPALGTATDTATALAQRPASGKWHIVAVADPFSAFTEPDETNNSNGTVDSFAAGIDLVAQGISGPAITGPGESVTVSLALSNEGVDDAGLAPLSIKLVSEDSPDAGGFTVYSTQLQLGARERLSPQLTFNVPSNVPAGDLRWLLQLDPASVVAEEDETNNVFRAGTRTLVSQNDLVAQSVLARRANAPNDPATQLFFGEPARFDVTLSNIGGAASANASVSLYISTNDTFNAVSDTKIIQQPVSVAAGQTKTVPVVVTLPTVDRTGATYENSAYFVIALAVSPSDADALNNIVAQGPLQLLKPGPDLLVRSLSTAAALGSGERFIVSRRIGNAGTRDAGTASYRYYLSVNDIATTDDLPLSLFDGGVPSVTLAAGEDDVRSEELQLPENLVQGVYYVSAIVDPAGAVAEFNEGNNGFAGNPVQVFGSPLVLDTPFLPDAVVDRPYRAELAAHGGTQTITFTPGMLPAGLALSSDGALTGTPTAVGAFAVPLTLTSGARSTQTTAVVRVLPNSSILAVATLTAPPVQRELPYAFTFAAQGGVRPYRWAVSAGALPAGLSLSATGVLSGETSAAAGSSVFSVRVSDGMGTIAERELRVRVVASGALVLQTSTPPPLQAGVEFATDFYAINANGSPIATSLSWEIIDGALPPGLRLDPRAQLLLVRGVPTKVGLFPVVLQVSDLEGRTDAIDALFVVLSSSALITSELPVSLNIGDEATGRVVSEGATGFRVASGALPSGLALSVTGELSGVVAEGALPGTHSFTILAEDGAGVQRLGGFGIEVVSPTPSTSARCGCSAVEVSVLPGVLLLGVLRRRRRASPRHV